MSGVSESNPSFNPPYNYAPIIVGSILIVSSVALAIIFSLSHFGIIPTLILTKVEVISISTLIGVHGFAGIVLLIYGLICKKESAKEDDSYKSVHESNESLLADIEDNIQESDLLPPAILKITVKSPLEEEATISLCINSRAGTIGYGKNLPNTTNSIERLDGVDWRNYPGDFLVLCEISVSNPGKKVLIESVYLPGSFFIKDGNYKQIKGKDDTVEFKYNGTPYSFTIQDENFAKHFKNEMDTIYNTNQGAPLIAGNDPTSSTPFQHPWTIQKTK